MRESPRGNEGGGFLPRLAVLSLTVQGGKQVIVYACHPIQAGAVTKCAINGADYEICTQFLNHGPHFVKVLDDDEIDIDAGARVEEFHLILQLEKMRGKS